MGADVRTARIPVGGFMGERVRTFDWSATPLGPAEGWPPGLRTAVSLVVTSPFLCALVWGRGLTFVAYNDGYRQMLGSKPEALGRPFFDVWSEVGEVLAPQVGRAMAGETVSFEGARFSLFRNGVPEEAWFDYGLSPVHDDAGQVAGMLLTGVETTSKVLAEAARAESEARWRALFEAMQEGFVTCEIVRDAAGAAVDLRYLAANAAVERLTGLAPERIVGHLASEAVPGLERHWTEAFARVAETGEPLHAEYPVAPLGLVLEIFLYRIGPDRVGGLFLDITERRASEERQTLLSREADHRAKNVLAVVKAALRLTRAPDLGSYIRLIEGRVAALARAQTLLSEDRWAGADLQTLLRGELDGFLDADSGTAQRATLEGPKVALPPGAAQPMAMAIHELATNAVKYGALSMPGGAVTVAWTLEGGPAGRLRLRWAEQGGPPVGAAPARRGFGTRMLDSTVRGQLGGTVTMSWEATGLVCDVEVPLGRVPSTVMGAGDNEMAGD